MGPTLVCHSVLHMQERLGGLVSVNFESALMQLTQAFNVVFDPVLRVHEMIKQAIAKVTENRWLSVL